jgi:AcrR family transcriptional regulator
VALSPPTRQEKKRDRVRDAILAAAEKVFAEEGDVGLSMRRLAEQINYSPGAIYNYFRSKDELYEALKESFFEHLLDEIAANMPEGPLTHDCLHHCLRLYIQAGLSKPFHYKMGFREMQTREHCSPIYDQESHSAKASGFLKSVIEEGMAQGLIRRADPMLVTHAVWASLHGLTMLLAQLPDYPGDWHDSAHISQEALVDFHIATIMRGISAPS